MHIAQLVRAGMVSAMLAASAPVQAQAPGLFTGDDDEFFGEWPICFVEISDRQIRRSVSDQGFHDIFLNVRNDQRVQVRATQGEWVYLLQVSTCSGWIMYGQRLRPA